MIINLETIQNITTALSAAYDGALPLADSSYEAIANIVQSTSQTTTHAWIGSMPSMRKWIGDRIIKELVGHKYSLTNEDYEATIAIHRNDILDDNFGIFKTLAQDLAFEGKSFKSRLLWETLADAENQLGYDDVPFVSEDHPDGKGGTQSNLIDGPGPTWYVMDTSRPVKPMILQVRQDVELVAMTKADDANVFYNKKFIWGIDGRFAAGFAFWQMVVASKQPLTEANLAIARARMRTFVDSDGKLLAVQPTTLVVGPSLETTAEKLVMNLVLANGESNVNRGKYKLIVSPYLP
jgi:phage major head subunit gpT-like protein